LALTEDSRKTILKRCLETIEGISDVEYQKRVWIRGEGPECDDFDEQMVFFFDDGEPIFESYKDFGISDEQYQLLMKFHGVLDVFSDEMLYHPAQEIISDPRWHEIQKMAKEVLKSFDYPKIAINSCISMNKSKSQTVRIFLETIAEIFGKKHQERAWVLREDSEDDDDTICDFFVMCDFILEKYKDLGITEAQHQILEKFRDKCKSFSDENGWPPAFIASPELREIMEMAREVLKAFDYDVLPPID
jgi:hypothetical protein